MISETYINSGDHGRLDRGGHRGEVSGFTLIELLVSVGLLALLSTLLVMVFSDGLEIWSSGEDRRRKYEEAHFIFQELSQDIKQTWMPVDKRFPRDRWTDADVPFLSSGFVNMQESERLGRWLELVRMKGGYLTGGEAHRMSNRLKRLNYLFVPGEGLYRGTFPLSGNVPHHSDWGLLGDPSYIENQFVPIGPNVLYMDVKFWGPWTQVQPTGRWTVEDPWGGGKGASRFWDSSRSLFEDFRMYNTEHPEGPAVPAMIRVRLEMTSPGRQNWPQLVRALPEKPQPEGTFQIAGPARQLPESGYFRIGSEWIRAHRSGEQFKIEKRGARNTPTVKHEPGSNVIYGKGFEMTFYVPLYPGKEYYEASF